MTPRTQAGSVDEPFDFENITETARALQISVNEMSRSNAAYGIEGHLCSTLTELVPSLYRRGYGKSPIDSGFIMKNSGGKVVGLEVKSLVLSLKHERLGGNSGPYWEADIALSEDQVPCDLLCVGFPLLRQPGWFAIHSELHRRLNATDLNASRLRITLSEAGHQIENVVPPYFWQYMTQLPNAAHAIEHICTRPRRQPQNEKHEIIEDNEGTDPMNEASSLDTLTQQLGTQTLDDLDNHSEDPLIQNTVELIRESLDQTKPHRYSVIDTVYRPMTAHFAISGPDQRTIFVDLKTRKCKELESHNGSQRGDTTTIAHAVAHNDFSQPTFTYTSSRWTYLASELLRNGKIDRFMKNGKEYPSRVVVLHRIETPKAWPYRDSDDGWLTGVVSSSSIVRLETTPEDIASQIISIFESHPFSMPKLEDMEELSHSQLLYGTGGLKHDVKNRQKKLRQTEHEFSGAEQVKKRKPQWVYQSETSLRFLHHCRKAREGLLFDYDTTSRELRSFAFTTWQWTPADLAYTGIRPRRSPVQTFELDDNVSFLLLSFCHIRHSAQRRASLVHPFAMNRLIADNKQGDPYRDSRLVIMMSENAIQPKSYDQPLYAIPATAIRTNISAWACHSKWRSFDLEPGHTMRQYRFDDMCTLIGYIKNTTKSRPEGSLDMYFRGQQMRSVTRPQVYSMIE